MCVLCILSLNSRVCHVLNTLNKVPEKKTLIHANAGMNIMNRVRRQFLYYYFLLSPSQMCVFLKIYTHIREWAIPILFRLARDFLFSFHKNTCLYRVFYYDVRQCIYMLIQSLSFFSMYDCIVQSRVRTRKRKKLYILSQIHPTETRSCFFLFSFIATLRMNCDFLFDCIF